MKILYLSYSDISGGAAKGAYRLHHAFLDNGIESELLVRRKSSTDNTVTQYSVTVSEHQKKLNEYLAHTLYPKWKKKEKSTQSFNLRYTGVHNIINNSDADAIILHWIGADTIHLKEIQKINKPIIWRLADMWAVLGSIHYTDNDNQYISGYNKYTHVIDDIESAIWHRKKRYLSHLDITFVCGSNWLSNKIKESYLFSKKKILTIPSSIDTDTFKPFGKIKSVKNRYQLDDRAIVLFGAQSAINDHRKGFDLLKRSLQKLKKLINPDAFQLLVFGTEHSGKTTLVNTPITFTGFINNESELAQLYSMSDVMILPSRMDNLPFTAIESLSCGTPVVGFNIGGIPEIIDHKKNGYIAQAFDTNELAKGIAWVLLNPDKMKLRKLAREKALSQYALKVQAERYKALLQETVLSTQV